LQINTTEIINYTKLIFNYLTYICFIIR